MPLPLAIPVAIGAYELAALAVAAIAAVWVASPQGREASRSAAKALSEALSRPKAVPIPLSPSLPRKCSDTKDCEDRCGPITAQIIKVMAELTGRILDLEADKFGLYGIRPSALPGVGSWPGHIQQFQQKQAYLRRLLNQASAMGCPVPPGAWHLATRNPPKGPRLQR